MVRRGVFCLPPMSSNRNNISHFGAHSDAVDAPCSWLSPESGVRGVQGSHRLGGVCEKFTKFYINSRKIIRIFLRPHEDLSSIYRVSESIDPRFSILEVLRALFFELGLLFGAGPTGREYRYWPIANWGLANWGRNIEFCVWCNLCLSNRLTYVVQLGEREEMG